MKVGIGPFAGIVLAIGFSLQTGCVNLKAVEVFADASKALAASSDQFYDGVYKSRREIRAYAFAVNDASDPRPTGDPFEAAVEGPAVQSEIRRHRAAVAALDTYGKALNDLATLNETDRIKKSAGELSSSLVSIKNTLDPSAANSDADKKLEGELGAAIVAVAKIFIDIEKQRVLHAKIKEAQPHVVAILDILVGDIEREVKSANKALRALRGSIRSAWFAALVPPAGAPLTAQTAQGSVMAAQLVRDEIDDRNNDRKVDAFLAKLKKSVASCKDAHDALAAEKIDQAAVVAFYNDARDLVSAASKLTKN